MPTSAAATARRAAGVEPTPSPPLPAAQVQVAYRYDLNVIEEYNFVEQGGAGPPEVGDPRPRFSATISSEMNQFTAGLENQLRPARLLNLADPQFGPRNAQERAAAANLFLLPGSNIFNETWENILIRADQDVRGSLAPPAPRVLAAPPPLPPGAVAGAAHERCSASRWLAGAGNQVDFDPIKKLAAFRALLKLTAQANAIDVVVVDFGPSSGKLNEVLIMSCDYVLPPSSSEDLFSCSSTHALLHTLLPGTPAAAGVLATPGWIRNQQATDRRPLPHGPRATAERAARSCSLGGAARQPLSAVRCALCAVRRRGWTTSGSICSCTTRTRVRARSGSSR